MTTYQSGGYLEAQLASIAEQTRLPDELIVCDDCSTDGTWSLLRQFAESAPFRVTLHRQRSNIGLSRNVQAVLAHAAATASVVVPADQDDRWLPEKLATLASAFEDPALSLWFSDARLIDELGEPIGLSAWEAVHFDKRSRLELAEGRGLRRLLHGMTVTASTMAVRSTVVTMALPFPAGIGNADGLFQYDGWLALVALLSGRVAFDPRFLADYRQHPSQITRMNMSTSAHAARASFSQRSRDLVTDCARAELVSSWVRDSGHVGSMNARLVEELFEYEKFLRVRTSKDGWPQRQRRIIKALTSGHYTKFARGTRTTLRDLIPDFGERSIRK